MTTITRSSSRSVASALAIQNVATADSARGYSAFTTSTEEVGTASKRLSTSRPPLRAFSLQDRYRIFFAVPNFQDSTLEIGWRPPQQWLCRGTCSFAITIVNSISGRDRRISADNCCPFSIRQIVAQSMQDGAAYQLSREQSANAVSFPSDG